MSTKANGKAIANSGSGDDDAKMGSDRILSDSRGINANNTDVMMFSDITYGPQEAELRFRLIHFWEARVPVKKTLLGLELLLIDEQERKAKKEVFRDLAQWSSSSSHQRMTSIPLL